MSKEPQPEFPNAQIDDQEEVKKLIAAMEKHFPISAEVLRGQARYLQSKGMNLPPHRTVQISSLFNMGDDGGIMCGISPKDSKEAVVISITHLKVHDRHPLFKEIRAYQKKRIKALENQ